MADLTPVIVRVAVPSPLRRLFDYLVPAEMVTDAPPSALQPGCRVKVTFGRREVTGLIIECADTSTFALEKLKPVTQLIDVEPLLPASLFRLFIWASRYYQHPIGDALFSTLPTLLRKGALPPEQGQKCWQLSTFGKGLGPDSLKQAPKQRAVIDKLLAEGVVSDEQLVALFSRAVLKPLEEKLLIESSNQCIPEVALDKLLRQDNLTLYPSQKQALEAIDHHHFNCSLLDGVTGSGKTEIYLQSIEKTLRYERQALVLIPEISLTPQTEKRFRDRFHVPIVTLHSGLTDKQRLNAWMQARSGQAKIILGTRSAIFTPLKAPGLIILDEEHDPSYKQQEGFRYSARDLAVIRAQQEHIPIILGSATPSLESLNNCHAGRYQHLVLSTRAGNAVQPDWQVIDLKTERSNAGIAATTLMAIDQTLKNNHQVLVFLNRRGFAPAMLCHQCGWTAECQHCDSRLTVHRARSRLICHHCDFQQRVPQQCPSCLSRELIAAGEGTERSEAFLQQYFPDTIVLRVDRDSTRKKGVMQEVFNTADSGESCILVGTQMLAKGHHFENVTLVAVLDADSGLFSPDFRSHERMGQLLTQVAGRSGRGIARGRVIVQTHQPDHPLLALLISQGYGHFARQLLPQRELSQLPPFRHMSVIRAESHRPDEADAFLRLARKIAEKLQVPTPALSYLGPLPALMEKRAGRFRYVLRIDADQRPALQVLLSAVAVELENHKDSRRVRWSIDVDPQEL
ncbi:MAG: primosomal protein N' (replication factor Y) [Parasphingorhabdus sp.]|jgi:primosomal protein N' (replication factor Y)|tara:strand:+ start:421 stop:2640 length:2220 start_codon:yes stop_codon:yes gene_type:complete